MKRLSSAIAAAALIAAGAAAQLATTASAATARAAGGHTVNLAHTSRGSLLVASNGFTLYMFTRDHGDKDSCVSVSGCLGVWPAYTVSGRPSAGAGVNARLLGTITIKGGKHQVTYAGHPLYLYVGDSGRAATGYLGFSSFGGAWDGMTASGKLVS
jgi:predicted lipoprotein with Yx(FWY)xxD motif